MKRKILDKIQVAAVWMLIAIMVATAPAYIAFLVHLVMETLS